MDEEENEYDIYGEDYGEEQESVISYHTEDFISKPILSEDGTVPVDILEFHHSFGYDCRKRFNLCVADPKTLIFASGNLIHFYNTSKNKLEFRRCSTGGGIGHVTKNPAFDHIAIGENGVDPPIIIYEWPSMEIVTVLQKGTTRSFSYLRYSPDGKKLVSQGGDPDYLITVWDWQISQIALQCKSHGQDVFNCVFSPTLKGHMTTCGSGHIKCWKMSRTFTGLKLQGELGRFGQTEISDIVGVYPMPDEKIISGCEWGNILVWNEGLIKIEVCRKNGRPCHESYISQFEYINGELISVGTDGNINVWYYETIDQAEPTDIGHSVEVEPIYEFSVGGQQDANNSTGRRAMLMQILRQDPTDNDNSLWYAQDGNGGLWLLDLSSLQTPKPARKLLTCHAGPVMDMDTSDWTHLVATIGADGRLHIYDYRAKNLKLTYQFRDSGRCVIWLPCPVEPSGASLICAFHSGVIRLVSVDLAFGDKKSRDEESVRLQRVFKPHTKDITCMTINPSRSLLVTGSEDCTIFVFNIQVEDSYPNLVPIGYVQLPSAATFLTWKPDHTATIFVGCSAGDCVQVDLPEEPQAYTTISYKLTECRPIIFKFESVKSSIIREKARVELERIRYQKIAVKREELRILKENNPGAEIDEAVFLESGLDDELQLPEIYIPGQPNPILAAFYTKSNTLILSVGGYDAGYIYEYSEPVNDKETVMVSSHLVVDSDDEEIRSYLFYNERKYVIFGMGRGEIRVCRVKEEEEADFSDYWILPMHDNFNGCIPSMRFSYDKKMLLTCGYDGNIFSFVIHDDEIPPHVDIPSPDDTVQIPKAEVVDIEDLDYLSLEQVIVRAEENRIMFNAKEEKDQTLAILRYLTEEYNSILKRNNLLPLSQRLTDADLELDPRITEDLNSQLEAEMNLVHKKLEYNVEKSKLRLKKLMDHFIEPITGLPFAVVRILKPETMVYSLRELKLTGEYVIGRVDAPRLDEFYENNWMNRTEDRYGSMSLYDSRIGDMDSDADDQGEGPQMQGLESFLKGLSPRTIESHLGDEINQMLKKYRSLKAKLEEQDQEWKILQSQRPDPKAINPEDEIAIETAKNTIGDYKLKASLNLDDDPERRPTVRNKYKQIINCRRKIHFRREDYNDKLRELREKKVLLGKEVQALIRKLRNIHAELPEELVKPLPSPPIFDYDIEFPEQNLQMEAYTPTAERVRASKMRKQSFTLDLPIEEFDDEYEVLLLDEKIFRPGKLPSLLGDERRRSFPREAKALHSMVPPETLAALEEAEKTDTKLERIMKRMRAERRNHEQDQILTYIHNSYEAFDEELDELEKERLEIVHESVYMDLFLLTMHQELIILKRFEGMENELSRKVKEKMKNNATVKKKIMRLIAKIDEKNNYIIKLQDKIKDTMTKHLHAIRDNKFYIFLKKIYKKKYRPPKPEGAESSSESSSSESSSEDEEADDGASEDSRKVALMHMEETIIPEGLDRDIYDEAFTVREQRYDMENRIRDEQWSIDQLQKELDAQKKNMKMIESELSAGREKLEAFLREKQRQLNDIDVTVILKMHQLQCFSDYEKAEKIQNCIVFDKTRLTQLYARVGELQQETAEQLAKHKNDKIHLHKMKLDCESMRKELEKLKEEIKKEMEQKFGQQVSLITLYEAVLRRLIYDIKANTGSLIKFYDQRIKGVKSEYKQQLQVLKDLIEDNTEKLSFLTVLEEELLKLRKTMNLKLMSEDEINKLESQYDADLCRLKTILKNQEQQKDWICKDIRNLSNKCKTLAPIDHSRSKSGYKDRRRPKLTLLDGTEKDANLDNYLTDESSASNEVKQFLIEDSDYYKKIIAIRHLLSQVANVDETNTTETIEKMLKEITDNLKAAGYCKEEIEKNLSDIMMISQEGTDFSQLSTKDTVESLSDMIHRYSTELREATFVQEIKQEVRDRLDDLFISIGIQDDTGYVTFDVINKLKTTNNVRSALKYLLEKLPVDTDDETKVALRKHIRQTLTQIMKDIEIKEDESLETQEDEF